MQRQNPAQRRYTRRFLTAMTIYSVALLGANAAIARYHPAGPALAAWSVLPALPLVAAIAIMGLYLREERDEYVRALIVRGIVVATGLLLAIATVWGFLEQGGVVAHVPAWTAFPIWAVCLGVAQGFCSIAARLERAA